MDILLSARRLVFLVAVVVLAGCNTLYYPPPLYAPLPKHKGMVDISLSSQFHNDIGIDASYAVTKNVLIETSNTFTTSDFQGQDALTSQTLNQLHGFNHNEFGIGYFTKSEDVLRAEMIVGFGAGSAQVTNTPDSGFTRFDDQHGRYIEPFFQGDFGIVAANVSLVLSARVGRLAFTSFTNESHQGTGQPSIVTNYSPSTTYAKGALIGRLGFDEIQFQLEMGLYLPLAVQELPYEFEPFFSNFGMSLRFDALSLFGMPHDSL